MLLIICAVVWEQNAENVMESVDAANRVENNWCSMQTAGMISLFSQCWYQYQFKVQGYFVLG